jgi:hypothetical protein
VGEPLSTLLILAGVGCAGMLFIVFVLPFVMRIGAFTEVASILMGGLGEYFGRPGLARACCLIILLAGVAGCVILVVLIITGVQCFSANPAPICRLIGRYPG